MKHFSIRDLESFSGIRAHTIRVWEKRYGLFNPQRNEGNIRRYLLEDVKLLLTLTLLQKKGSKISRLALMAPDVLFSLAKTLTHDESRLELAQTQLIEFMYATDIEAFEFVLDNCLLSWGIDKTIQKVMVPFMEKVQLFSYNDSSSEVHFIVTALRKKLILGIEKTNPLATDQKLGLLFLPQGEHFDLVLLYITYALKQKGLRVLYMGTNISEQNAKAMFLSKKPDYLFTYIPQKQKFKFPQLAAYLQQTNSHTPFYVAVCDEDLPVHNKHNKVQFVYFKNVADFLNQDCNERSETAT